MTRISKLFSNAGILAIALHSSLAIAQSFGDGVPVPPVPADIKVPAGNVAFLKGHAVGTQNHICLPASTPGGVGWRLFGPQATLYLKFKLFYIEIVQQIMTHFLSANPDEAGLARPTWQSSLDTSAIWAKALMPSTDPNYVAAGAVPWLLLQVTGAERGPTGGGLLLPATYIHRLNTSGGVMPSTGCSTAENLGATALVPYTADYFFYKAGN